VLETQALADARTLLASWLAHPRFRAQKRGPDGGADLVVEEGDLRLVVELKWSADAASIGAAANQVKRYAAGLGRRTIPVVATSFMGDVGRRICDDAGTSWFDLSGNAHIIAPGLRIIIEGRPNKFVRRGRPSSAFAPKSARIARRLLIEPGRWFRQRELARETGLDDGFTSKIVRRLEQDALLERDEAGALRVTKPDLMLDAWAEVYAFEKHAILRGHVTARGGEELLRRVAQAMKRSKIRHAATGLGAAWLQTEFAGRGKVDITRFKGLGEMPHIHLRETTMAPGTRTLLRVKVIDDRDETKSAVDRLMGNRPEARFDFIQENAAFVTDLDI